MLLLHVDSPDDGGSHRLGELTKLCTNCDMTLVCAWSAQECARRVAHWDEAPGGKQWPEALQRRYLEVFKAYETKPATLIMERTDSDYLSRLTACLTTVRSVNRTDALSLATHVGSFGALLQAPQQELLGAPGIGPTKVKRLWEAFHEPFRRGAAAAARATGAGGQVAPPAAESDEGEEEEAVDDIRAEDPYLQMPELDDDDDDDDDDA